MSHPVTNKKRKKLRILRNKRKMDKYTEYLNSDKFKNDLFLQLNKNRKIK